MGEHGIDEVGAGPRDAPGVGGVAAERIAATGVWRAAWDRAEHAALVAAGLPGGGRGGAGSGVHRSARAGRKAWRWECLRTKTIWKRRWIVGRP